MKVMNHMIFILMFTIFILGTGHFVVYKSLIAILNTTNIKVIYFLKIFFLLSSTSFIVVTLLTQASYSKLGAILYKLTAFWLGTLYFIFVASVIFILIYVSASFLKISLDTARIIGIVLFILAILVSIYGVLNSFNIKTTNYNIKIKNLPESWNGKSIVLFSDSHFGNIRNLGFGNNLVSKINEQNPMLVLIAGDYYDGPPVNDEQIGELMAKIKTEKGVYFASGNHEEYGDHSRFIKSLEDGDVKVLDNKSVLVDGVIIVGVDYLSGSNKYKIENVFKGLNLEKDIPKILIKHAPNLLKEVEDFSFDLVVSGHVHNGQVWPGSLFARIVFKEFAYGLNYLNEMAVVTSSGVGTWGPPQRIGTKSEIVVLRFESK